MHATLPKSLVYKTATDLIRIGRENDGGYLISESDINSSDILIGMGINDDWSFEKDFFKKKQVEIHAYDASIDLRVFIKRFLSSLVFKFYNPKRAIYWFKVSLSYYLFFTKNKIFHFRKFVGLDIDNSNNCSFKYVLEKTKSKNIFLKIDIEGSEYRFLDELISVSDRISGLVIEFHDCDIHMCKIENFVSKFNLKIAHIHINNFAPIKKDGTPLVIEITFSRNCDFFDEFKSPHPQDMPNNRYAEEIELAFQ